MGEYPSPIPFDENAEWEAEKARKRIIKAPTRVAIFLQDCTQLTSTTDRSREIIALPATQEDVFTVLDAFDIVTSWEEADLADYCCRIDLRISPAELTDVYWKLREEASAIDASRVVL